MRIVVFGATGGTGRAVIVQALRDGHNVTAFVRDTAKLAPTDRLTIVAGDAMRAGDVAPALVAQDAVVIALGDSQNAFAQLIGARRTTPRDVCEVGTRNIVEGLPAGADLPVVVVSAFGVGETRHRLPLAFKLFYRLVLRHQIADKERQEALLKATRLNYVLVQPVALTDKPATGRWTASTDGALGGQEVSRADLAAFILRTAADRSHVRQTVAFSGSN